MTLKTQARDCMQRQAWSAAVNLWQRVLQQTPEDADSALALAECLRRLGLLDEAVVMVKNALAQIRADLPAQQALHARASLMLAQLHLAQGRRDDAGAAFSPWLSHPTWGVQAALGVAQVWLAEGYPSRAAAALAPFAAQDPDAAQAWALAQFEAGDAEAALAKLLPTEGSPLSADALSNALMFANYTRGYRQHLQTLRPLAEQVFGPGDAPAPAQAAAPNTQRANGRALRVGWISADFRAHPIGYFLSGFFPHLQAEQVDNFGYHNGHQHDAWTDRLARHCTRFESIAGWSTSAVCERLAADELDVLIDLSGHTQGHRLDVFARRACRVQASFLGYFSSTFVPEMDYLITDAMHVLPEEAALYSEALVYLPHSRFCYAAPQDAPAPQPPPCLQNGYVTWGAFTNLAKVSDECVALWSQVLHATPDSRLQLRWKTLVDGSVRQALRERFVQHGIAPGRIELHGAMRHADMMAAYHEVDVVLDTWPFSGATSTCEALWMGVPVITQISERPAGRQTASILQTLGETQWIAPNPDEFVALALACAKDTALRTHQRIALRKKIASTSLGDGRLFAQSMAQTLYSLRPRSRLS